MCAGVCARVCVGSHTLIINTEQSTFLRVATETDQDLIGRAARRVVGLALREDPQLPGRLLRAVPEG